LGLAFNSSGFLYQVHQNNTISEISPNGTSLGTIATAGLDNPTALAINSSGVLFVANDIAGSGAGNATKYSATGSDLGVFATGSVGNNNYDGLAFNNNGYFFVANPYWNTITIWTPGGVLSSQYNVSGAPDGVAFDSSDDMYVANATGNNVTEYNAAGSSLGVFISGLDDPTCLAFDSAGDLYVGNEANNTIKEYNSAGSLLNTISVNAPLDIAFEPTPEPSTLALTAMGALTSLFMFRRRK